MIVIYIFCFTIAISGCGARCSIEYTMRCEKFHTQEIYHNNVYN